MRDRKRERGPRVRMETESGKIRKRRREQLERRQKERGIERGTMCWVFAWFVFATEERKKKALETEIRKMCICMLTIYMYCVQRLTTYPQSHIEKGNIQRDSCSPATSLPPSRLSSPLTTQVLKTNTPPSFLLL